MQHGLNLIISVVGSRDKPRPETFGRAKKIVSSVPRSGFPSIALGGRRRYVGPPDSTYSECHSNSIHADRHPRHHPAAVIQMGYEYLTSPATSRLERDHCPEQGDAIRTTRYGQQDMHISPRLLRPCRRQPLLQLGWCRHHSCWLDAIPPSSWSTVIDSRTPAVVVANHVKQESKLVGLCPRLSSALPSEPTKSNHGKSPPPQLQLAVNLC